MSNIEIVSTTDTEEQVNAAIGGSKARDVEENKPAVESEISSENEPTESEPEENEVEESEELEESAKDDAEKSKKKGGFKRRIDKLTSKVSAAEQEAQYWRQEALKNQAPKEARESKPTPQADRSEKPNPDNYDSHTEYVEALTDWKLEARFSEQKAKERESALKSEMQNQIEAHGKRVEAFAKSHDDFEEMIHGIDDIPMSLTVQEVILSSENGPELMYELAKNREEYARICGLSAIGAARELGKFEARLQKSDEKTTELKTTKAPRPLSPVGSKSTGVSAKSLDDMDFQEFKKAREAQLRK